MGRKGERCRERDERRRGEEEKLERMEDDHERMKQKKKINPNALQCVPRTTISRVSWCHSTYMCSSG